MRVIHLIQHDVYDISLRRETMCGLNIVRTDCAWRAFDQTNVRSILETVKYNRSAFCAECAEKFEKFIGVEKPATREDALKAFCEKLFDALGRYIGEGVETEGESMKRSNHMDSLRKEFKTICQ